MAAREAVTAWWRALDAPPEPFAGRQRLVLWLLALVVAATRFLAVARTLWDWDEALFALALRDYDVTLHHPHPPGFPLFIGTAKLLALAGMDDFRALQAVSVVASLLVFPAMVWLARELRAPYPVAIAAGLLLAFSPNVWLFGGTALSDVPSMLLSIVACALLLRGCRSNASLLAGALVLAIAAGYRPQNLLIAFVPALIALVKRPRIAIIGALLGAAIIAASYGAAVSFSGGWGPYRETVQRHEEYIRTHDSFVAPIRPPLWKVADDFFFWPYRLPFLNISIALLILGALLRRRAHALLALATFGPFLLFAWLYLDFHSSSRFSIAYMPLFALLAADGLELLRRARFVVLGALVTATFVWMLPPLRIVRTTVAPPVAAAEWIRANHRGAIEVDARLAPFGDLLLADYPRGRGLALREGDAVGGINFTRDRARLARALTRPRYFEVSVVRVR